MPITKQLVRMGNAGPLVEVEVDTSLAVQAANLGEILEVKKTFDTISDFLQRVTLPFTEAWRQLSSEVEIKEADLKITVGISASGNFFLAKGTTEANLELSIKFTPREAKVL